MGRVSIIIPSNDDPALARTMDDIRRNAVTDPEVIVVYNQGKMRSAINEGVEQSTGDYIIKCDSHCAFDHGFDEKLLKTIVDNWVVIPIRYALDVETWEVMDDRPIVHERLAVTEHKLTGVRWVSRTQEARDDMIAEDMVFQGSFYMMSRSWWDTIGPLQTEGYGEFAQEAIEIALKTYTNGGKVIKNKHTWYAHKHRKFGRVKAPGGTKEANLYSLNYWTNERKDDFEAYMRRFHEDY